ncbi:MAG: GGDEF domain-containing protein [Pseudomonadota bacterium]
MDAALSHRGALAAAALTAYAAIAVAYVTIEVPGLGIGHLFYLPIAMVALATGATLGAGAGGLATMLYVVCVILNDRIPSADVLTASTVIRGLTYVSSGAVIGAFAARNRLLVEQLRDLAARDFLTGLLNARAFDGALGRRCADERPFALLLADLDELKQTNDRDGHEAGNTLLRGGAAALQEMLRDGDELARIGGDEFAILADVASAADAERLARRVEARLGERGVALSVGWAQFPSDGGTAVALCGRADERLYASKRARKGGGEVVALRRPAAG